MPDTANRRRGGLDGKWDIPVRFRCGNNYHESFAERDKKTSTAWFHTVSVDALFVITFEDLTNFEVVDLLSIPPLDFHPIARAGFIDALFQELCAEHLQDEIFF